MSQSRSNLFAAWLIATACIGAIALMRETVPGAEATGRVDPAKPMSARQAPQQRFRPDVDYRHRGD